MITYVLIFVLKFIDCLLTTLKTKAMINGHDRLSNLLKAISAMVYMMVVSKIIIDKSIMAIFIMGLSEYAGGEVGTFIYKHFENKYKQAKPYQFTIKFKLLETCEFVDMQLREQNIKTIINKNNRTLKAISLNKEDSTIIKSIIEGKFKNYSVNEFVEYNKNKVEI